jgi:conjugal transfer/entry exclusion protein
MKKSSFAIPVIVVATVALLVAVRMEVARAQETGTTERGYLQVNAQSQQLWNQLGTLQDQRHQAEWNLFELMNQTPRNRSQIQQGLATLAGIKQQIEQVRGQLKQYWVPLPTATGARAARANAQTPSASTTPAAPTPAS